MTSEDVPNFRTMFAFSPPPQRPFAWALTYPQFTDALLDHDPEAFTDRWHGHFTGESLSFDFTLSADNEVEGITSTAPEGVAAKDCTAAVAAEFAYWLREAVLSADAEVHVNITEGIEWRLPALALPSAEPEELRTMLIAHVRDVLDHEERHLGRD